MKRLRQSFTALLVLVLLPWGALVNAAQTVPPKPPAVSTEAPLQTGALPQRHKCRTATLTGGVCRLDFSPDEEDDLTPPVQKEPAEGMVEDLTPAEWNGSVPLPPPRMN